MNRLIILLVSFLLASNVSAQDFPKYGFNVSLPCDLKKQKSLTGRQAASMGFEGIVSWTTFTCLDRADGGGGTLFRVTTINHGSYTGGREEYALQIQKQYKSKGKATEIIQYLGAEACKSKSVSTIRRSNFDNWMIDFSHNEWSYTLQILNNTGEIEENFDTMKNEFRLK